MEQKTKDNRKFAIELTEEEIAMLKAGLVYLLNDNEFGAGIWMTCLGACWGRRENESFIKVNKTFSKLDELNPVKPDFGDWGDIERLGELFRKEYQIYKKQGEDAEREMYEEAKNGKRNK